MSSRGRRSPPQSLADPAANESSPLLVPGSISLNYNSDSAVYDRKEEEGASNGSRRFFGAGSDGSSADDSDEHEDFSDLDRQFSPTSYRQQAPDAFRQIPRANWHGLGSRSKFKRSKPLPAPGTVSHTTRRSRMRTIKKQLREPPSAPKLRVSAYCTCDQLQLFKLLKWLERVETGQLPGGELHPDGWRHKMYMGAIHSSCAPAPDLAEGAPVPYQQKDAFYFATGCAVFWGLTRAEEQAHLVALGAFSVGPVKQVEVEDMDYTYGDASLICNDAITLSSNRASEKLAVSFAMAQSSKLDVFEERVEETIRETKHVPQNLAATGSIQYSQSDISKLIGRLFIERSDVNLNSDMLDEPDFFWEDDEYEPLYKKVMKYLSVDNRVQILNTRLDILRELLDVLSQQLAHQHDTKLEMIVIWLIVAEVAVQVVWNILIKDILGFFPHSDTSD
ncbi:hypothetical protein PF005_g23322 [Phytophthora fragariae]|uniref:DUF155 domain-containing protein n=2 Tax=Phytophthora TaxID=4783 RepID=A0A6A3WCJ8_9STRA|nr:hypothetical protein PF003_g33311 [Phytophthora fragariae]KAE8991063.1 hypothetical protein PR002_g20967 [Phytophthora rubi]KAE8925743.1 hypothetical protein PF009_g24060 [Phytophthora fragariae]KAE8980948.1 hypothetical protein PF011_g22226 [Phytophthora fragariae]KAE8997474.1 hypothetical protein PR001_g19569 [Phytophthora rubi]